MRSPYPVIVSATLSAKKGDAQPVRVAVWQSIPFPCAKAEGAFPSWSNMDTLDPNNYRNPDGVRIPNLYRFALVKDGADFEDNMTDYAGYCLDRRAGTVVPGGLTYRGQPVGEVCGTYDARPHYAGGVNFSRYNDGTPSLRQWLTEALTPILREAITANADTLRKHALDNIRQRFAEQVAGIRAAADKLEAEASAILATLEK